MRKYNRIENMGRSWEDYFANKKEWQTASKIYWHLFNQPEKSALHRWTKGFIKQNHSKEIHITRYHAYLHHQYTFTISSEGTKYPTTI